MMDFLAYSILVVIGGFVVIPSIGLLFETSGEDLSYSEYMVRGLTILTVGSLTILSIGCICWAIDRLTK